MPVTFSFLIRVKGKGPALRSKEPNAAGMYQGHLSLLPTLTLVPEFGFHKQGLLQRVETSPHALFCARVEFCRVCTERVDCWPAGWVYPRRELIRPVDRVRSRSHPRRWGELRVSARRLDDAAVGHRPRTRVVVEFGLAIYQGDTFTGHVDTLAREVLLQTLSCFSLGLDIFYSVGRNALIPQSKV